ncbi:Uncharacterised protein [Vibrio cholerae]|nr:Uncharacterised protein [Vibrio cholerae]
MGSGSLPKSSKRNRGLISQPRSTSSSIKSRY